MAIVRDKVLPTKGVMFLGGHPNVVKKLRQIYPKWDFVNDDDLHKKMEFHHDVIFYWTRYGSHTIMQRTFSKMDMGKVKILYVTATNIKMLVDQMHEAYLNSLK